MKIKYLALLMIVMITACASEGTEDALTDMDTTNLTEDDMEAPTLLMGEFQNGAHPTMGKVTLNADHTALNITDFKTDNGPLLEMYLSTDLQASEYVTLGELKGLEGNFDYTVPNGSSIDYSEFKYVMVWCVDFSVNFGHAVLE